MADLFFILLSSQDLCPLKINLATPLFQPSIHKHCNHRNTHTMHVKRDLLLFLLHIQVVKYARQMVFNMI